MTYPTAQLLAALERVWLVILVVIVNAVAIPAIAWFVAEALPISDAYVAGLVRPPSAREARQLSRGRNWPNAPTSRSSSPGRGPAGAGPLPRARPGLDGGPGASSSSRWA
jgi:hypothetical protein